MDDLISIQMAIEHWGRSSGNLTNDQIAELQREIESLPSADEQDDNRLYIRIYANDEPSRKAEKLYQICGETENQEVAQWLKEYFPSADRPTDEEDQLKFYYVESIDDYWIGMRIDNFYYAEWHERLGFVWTHSRYLPWGEHVVDERTLWKEHTYPSEPIEIPFTEWIVGFVKKYFADRPTTDCTEFMEWLKAEVLDENNWELNAVAYGEIICRKLKKLGWIDVEDGCYVDTRPTGKWVEVEDYNGDIHYQCDQCGEEFILIDGTPEDNNYWHCPNCGSYNGGGEAVAKGADNESTL